MNSELGALKFPNIIKILVPYLRANLPADVYVSSQVPETRREKMVIVVLASGAELGGIRARMNVNLMTWGKSWEEALDLSLDVDSVVRGLNSLRGEDNTSIVQARTAVLPVPSGDGENAGSPVYSASYELIINSKNS